MALPFDLTEDATADFEAAVRYIATRSEASALRVADALEEAFLLLSQHPYIGRHEPEAAALDEVQFWTAAGYLIAYLPDRSPILILAVLHGARDAEQIIPDRVDRL